MSTAWGTNRIGSKDRSSALSPRETAPRNWPNGTSKSQHPIPKAVGLSETSNASHSVDMTEATGVLVEHPEAEAPARRVDRRWSAAAAGLSIVIILLAALLLPGQLAKPATGTITGVASSHPPTTSGPRVLGLTIQAWSPDGQLVASTYAADGPPGAPTFGAPTFSMDLAPGDYTIGVASCPGAAGKARVHVSSGSSTDVRIYCS